MRSKLFPFCFLVTAAISSFANATDSNWPQFRGARANGLSSVPAPITWNVASGENIAWEQPIPGLAHASPIIWKDFVYVTTAVRPGSKSELKIGLYGSGDSYKEKEAHQWRLICMDVRTGRVRWDNLAFECVPSVERHTKATHCNSTPAIDGKHIVAIFGSEGLFCFDMNGRKLWRKELGKMDAGPYDSPTLQWGFASSPIIYDNKIIVQCDVISERYLAAFDIKDGHQLWRTARAEPGGTWCTPNVAITKGRKQIICNGWKDIGGFDLNTGAELWRLEGGGDIPVPTPVIGGELAYFTSAHGKYRPLRAVRLDSTGDVTPPSVESTNSAVAWCYPRIGSYMQTPLLVGELLFSCDVNGILSCLDARTGKINYSERLGTGNQGFTSSGIAVGQNVYFTGEEGDVFVLPANAQFSVLATNKLGGACLSTPAASRGVLFFRTTEKLIAIGEKSAKTAGTGMKDY
jgi:outer membrane protein assembly factor BamB